MTSDEGGDTQYHLEVSAGQVAPSVLLPGDPERLDVIAEHWDEANEIASHREYRTMTGEVNDVQISASSTGIGSPSASIAVEELASVGAETFIRVGSCGAIQPEVEIGDLVITTGAVRQEGTSDEYVRQDYPAVADYEVVTALVWAAESLDLDYHVGVTMSADSFYAGQARDGFDGFEAAGASERLEELRRANVLNIEMEASAILTLTNLFGLRGGAICTVFADRNSGEFRPVGEARAAATATKAVELLAAMDEATSATGSHRFHPGLPI